MLRILVVEDDSSVRGWLDILLTQRGHSVQTAASAAEAAAFVLYDRPDRPDLALLDMVLPDSLGVALAPTLRTHFPAIRLVFMTGWTDKGATEKETERFGPLLRKPFSTSDLLALIEDQPPRRADHEQPTVI